MRTSCLSVHFIFEGTQTEFDEIVQGDSKLLSGFPWPIIFKPEKQNKTAYGI